MFNLARERLAIDLRQAARIMSETGKFETGQGLMLDAADEIERLRDALQEIVEANAETWSLRVANDAARKSEQIIRAALGYAVEEPKNANG